MDNISVDTSPLKAFASRVGNSSRFLAGLVPPVNAALATAEREVVEQISGPVLKVRSGQARASVRVLPAELHGDTIDGGVGTNSAYLPFLYRGGTIRPKNAKMLAIPIGPALTPAGVPRYASPRDVVGLFAFRSRAGNLLLAKREGAGKLTPYFVLKDSVTIGPHDFLSQPKAALTQTLQKTLAAAVAKQVTGHVAG